MVNGHPVTEQERASATLSECEDTLRRAREDARRAGELLRRATRGVVEAERALREATRWVGRVPRAMAPGREAWSGPLPLPLGTAAIR